MDFNGLIMLGIGLGISIIGYFIKQTLNDLKRNNKEMLIEIKKLDDLASSTKSRLDVVEVDYMNKISNLNAKFEMLYEAVKDLTAEIKQLNKELNNIKK